MRVQTNIIILCIFMLFLSFNAQATDRDKFCKVASYTFMGLIKDIEAADKKHGFGEFICKAGGGSSCSLVGNVGEGICKAGNGSSCSLVSNVGEGICKAGGGYSCSLVSGLGEGICKGAGVNCYSTTLEEALCKAAGMSNCSNVSFSQLLAFSIETCGIKIFYSYESR